YISNFWRYKNFEVVVRAFAMLPQALRDSYRLLLVGYPYDKAYFDEIAALVAAQGVGSRVELIAGRPQRELARLYDDAHLFVFASLIENSPNIVLEAMSRGAPLVLSKSEPMPEFGGDAARYFDPKSPEDLAASLQALLGDPQALGAMRSASLARASLYSWDRFTQRVVDLVHRQ
ncbi:MAG: glycosyltransferase, partial [Steroidobacteraceae bacterium]|nr:glycosyltransferase [Steroidobacteraceae bacterium]